MCEVKTATHMTTSRSSKFRQNLKSAGGSTWCGHRWNYVVQVQMGAPVAGIGGSTCRKCRREYLLQVQWEYLAQVQVKYPGVGTGGSTYLLQVQMGVPGTGAGGSI
jgi:hypothetical protein